MLQQKDQVRAIVDAGISVVGHIGLTPQTSSALGGFRVQGKLANVALELYKDAMALQVCKGKPHIQHKRE